jgi:hypothetical protein
MVSAHHCGPRKSIQHELPSCIDHLPSGKGLCCLASRNDKRADERIVIVTIHPQVKLGFGKRYRLL